MKKILTLKIKDTTEEVKLSFEELGIENPTYKEVARYLLRNNDIIKARFNGINFEYLNMSGRYISLKDNDMVRNQAFRINYIYYISTKKKVAYQKNIQAPVSEEKYEPEKINEPKINEPEKIKEPEPLPETSLHRKQYEQKENANFHQNKIEEEQLEPKKIEYAGFGARLGAYIIDSLIIGIPFGITNTIISSINENISSFVSILGIFAIWLYFAKMESGPQQATIGKKISGIKVTDLNGNRISFAKASGRHFGKIISALIFLIGYLMVAFTEKKQALHDIIAGCLVIKK